MDFKEKIAELISEKTNLSKEEILPAIEVPKDSSLGDFAFPCFSLAKQLKKAPPIIASDLSKELSASFLESVQATGPYLNFKVKKESLAKQILSKIESPVHFPTHKKEFIGIESPSPNTNKPLHLGHVRNMLLGVSLKNIIQKTGNKVVAFDLVNDKGTHICKSMIAYDLFGEHKTPHSEHKKGDHFVGEYYVKFAQALKENPALEEEAQAMLLKWEQNDLHVHEIWKKMRKWCLDGMNETYKLYGVEIDKTYYESEIYTEGKKIVNDAVKHKIFEKDEDGAIFVDLTEKGLGKKYVQRSDGTSIYITQDIFLAKKRFDEFKLDKMVYVVGNEQNHHFRVLFEIFKLLNYEFAEKCFHLSYGMIYLPEGKMKSREGTVVDADNFREEMIALAREEVKKRYSDLDEKEIEKRAEIIGVGAINFFILKYDAQKDFTYDPSKSLSFQGETGPYVQYAYARIKSILRKSKHTHKEIDYSLLQEEREKVLISKLGQYHEIVEQAAKHYKPSLITTYILELAQLFNSYYHEVPVLVEEHDLKNARLILIEKISIILKDGLSLLNITAPEEM